MSAFNNTIFEALHLLVFAGGNESKIPQHCDNSSLNPRSSSGRDLAPLLPRRLLASMDARVGECTLTQYNSICLKQGINLLRPVGVMFARHFTPRRGGLFKKLLRQVRNARRHYFLRLCPPIFSVSGWIRGTQISPRRVRSMERNICFLPWEHGKQHTPQNISWFWAKLSSHWRAIC